MKLYLCLIIVYFIYGTLSLPNGLSIPICVTVDTDMPEEMCSSTPVSLEDMLLDTMSFTQGAENSYTLTAGKGPFLGIHIAAVDPDGNFLSGLSTTNPQLGVFKKCGPVDTPVDTLIHVQALVDTTKMDFNFVANEDVGNVNFRVIVVYARTPEAGCEWGAGMYNLTVGSATQPADGVPQPSSQPSTEPTSDSFEPSTEEPSPDTLEPSPEPSTEEPSSDSFEPSPDTLETSPEPSTEEPSSDSENSSFEPSSEPFEPSTNTTPSGPSTEPASVNSTEPSLQPSQEFPLDEPEIDGPAPAPSDNRNVPEGDPASHIAASYSWIFLVILSFKFIFNT